VCDALAARAASTCLICGGQASAAGSVTGSLSTAIYQLARCPKCGFAFVTHPRTDFHNIYDEAYYAGRGADPSVRYDHEMSDPRTVRTLEWQGIVEVVMRQRQSRPATKWLDYGCGYGGLVRFVRTRGHAQEIVGHDQGYAAERAGTFGIAVLGDDDLDQMHGAFDVITAIEVLEHVIDPVAELERMAHLLAPGGLLFITTGNAARHPDLTRWRYVVPEIHVSFFAPNTLEHLYRRVGLEPLSVGFTSGFDRIVTYRVLKQLRRSRRRWFDIAPIWQGVARLADRREGLSQQPAATKPPL
jgi:SAM-dependent methyltransferase